MLRSNSKLLGFSWVECALVSWYGLVVLGWFVEMCVLLRWQGGCLTFGGDSDCGERKSIIDEVRSCFRSKCQTK